MLRIIGTHVQHSNAATILRASISHGSVNETGNRKAAFGSKCGGKRKPGMSRSSTTRNTMINWSKPWRKCPTLISREPFEYNIWIGFRMTLICTPHMRWRFQLHEFHFMQAAPWSCHYVYVINIIPAFSAHRLRTLCVLGCDFTRPFDQRRNVRAKVPAEMLLTLKRATLYGALLCRGSQSRPHLLFCTDKSTRLDIFKLQERKICKGSAAFFKWQNE